MSETDNAAGERECDCSTFDGGHPGDCAIFATPDADDASEDASDYTCPTTCVESNHPGREHADWIKHHPKCYQRTGVPADLPADLCDCGVWRLLDATKDASTGVSEPQGEDVDQKKSRRIPSRKNPPWWPTAEQKRHADAGCAHPDECRLADPSREQIEALARVVEGAENPLDDGSPVSTYGELAAAILASDWLAAREAAARAEERERIAQAIEAETPVGFPERYIEKTHAARIARGESR